MLIICLSARMTDQNQSFNLTNQMNQESQTVIKESQTSLILFILNEIENSEKLKNINIIKLDKFNFCD